VPNAGELIRRIRQALAKGRYVVRLHARVRMRERGITDAEVREVIIHGSLFNHGLHPLPELWEPGFRTRKLGPEAFRRRLEEARAFSPTFAF